MNDIENALRDAAVALPEAPPDGIDAAIAERAVADGLLDVAYAVADSPLGPLTIAATERGLVTLAYPNRPLDTVLEELSRHVSPRVMEAPGRLDSVRRELDEYFDGKRDHFDVPLDWSLTHGFGRRVLQATARIRFGEVATYKQVAEKAGSPRAVRAAGNALGSNPMPVIVPCHRVLRTGGKLGGYTGGLEKKEFLLSLEGVLDR
jgi:methylated-DNA-[protein]-cysteine S-methyltransferase